MWSRAAVMFPQSVFFLSFNDMRAALTTCFCNKGQQVTLRLRLIGLLANDLEQSCF